MKPTAESIWSDISILSEEWGIPWTEDIALEAEAQILVSKKDINSRTRTKLYQIATEESLCLDPSIQVTRISNALEYISKPKRHKKKLKYNTVEREQKLAKKAENIKMMTLMDTVSMQLQLGGERGTYVTFCRERNEHFLSNLALEKFHLYRTGERRRANMDLIHYQQSTSKRQKAEKTSTICPCFPMAESVREPFDSNAQKETRQYIPSLIFMQEMATMMVSLDGELCMIPVSMAEILILILAQNT